MGIPVQFGIDLPSCVEIKSQKYMNTTQVSEKPLIPALFQIAACANDSKSLLALKDVLALSRIPLGDVMMDPERLEAIVKGIARKKKQERVI